MPFYRCMPPAGSGGGGGGGDVTDGANVIFYDENNIPHIAYDVQYISISGLFTQNWMNSDPDFQNLVNNDGENIYNIFIGNKITKMQSSSFANKVSNIKGSVIFGENVVEMNSIFSNSPTFNRPVEVLWNGFNIGYPKGTGMLRMVTFFSNSTMFNSSINIVHGNEYPIDIRQMYVNCYNFNIPVNIPRGANSAQLMFSNCSNFNSRVLFVNRGNPYISLYSPQSMFSMAQKFNQPMVFPKGMLSTGMSYIFSNCKGFNQPVAFCFSNYDRPGESIGDINIYGLFYNCDNMYSDIIFFGNNLSSNNFMYANRVLYKTSYQKRINVYVNNVTLGSRLLNTSATYSFVGAAITWTATTNGYYNATYNIYVLNNWQDALNNFNNYYYNFYGEYPDFGE